MSVFHWRQAYYRGRVLAAAKDPISATRHSLLKWEGAHPQVLKQFGVRVVNGRITNIDPSSGASFSFNANTCALCHYTFNQVHADRTDMPFSPPNLQDCKRACPLYETVGDGCSDKAGNPWGEFLWTDDPEPMIQALRTTLLRLEEQQKEEQQ